jgi:GTP-binding protein YchF
MELIYSDIEQLEKRIDRVAKLLKGDKSLQPQLDLYNRLLDALNEGKTARSVELSDDERELLADVNLLTIKPIIYVANVSEDEAAGVSEDNVFFKNLKAAADAENAEVIPVCAGIEAEIAELEPEEKKMFLADMGIDESGLDRLIKASYSLLGYISYLTAGPKEVRAWTIVNGTKAPQAAGKIHSDFERGFIRAEIVAFDDLMACGSMNAAKEKGLVRSEGKEYVIHDGDVVLFRFNV